MTCKCHLSTEQKGKIVGMATAGMTKTSMGHKLGIERTKILAFVSWEATCGTVAMPTKTGRPRKATERDLCQLQLTLLKKILGWRLPRWRIKVQPQSPLALSVLRLMDLGFNNWVAVKKPFLRNSHHEQRFWLESWTIVDWEKVLWTNKSSFEIGKKSQHVKVRTDSKSKYTPNFMGCCSRDSYTYTAYHVHVTDTKLVVRKEGSNPIFSLILQSTNWNPVGTLTWWLG